MKIAVNRILATLGYEIRRIPRLAAPTDSDLTSADSASERWAQPFEVLRKKWTEVPTTQSGRRRTSELLRLSDGELLREWERSRQDITTGRNFAHRGWYHALYREMVTSKKIMDVGSGFAIDSISFSQFGARVTFVDLAEDNLEVVKRLCRLLGIRNCQFVLLQDVDTLRGLEADYDVIMASGSLHHAPVSVIRPEVHELRRHLRRGGRWLQLAYPRARWVREGSLPFSKWGEVTDGVGTPWAEWYDLDKLRALHTPGRFEVILCLEFHGSDFIWFDPPVPLAR